MIAASVLFMSHWNIAVHGSLIGPLLLAMTFVLGVLMISTMPFNSFKEVEFIKARPSFVVFGVILLVSIVAVTPAFMLFSLLTIYTASGPVRWAAWRIQGKKGLQEDLTIRQTAAPAPASMSGEQQSLPQPGEPGENIEI
jgi:CDP-diacylglycerol--serine O-phosphatidyltransferase